MHARKWFDYLSAEMHNDCIFSWYFNMNSLFQHYIFNWLILNFLLRFIFSWTIIHYYFVFLINITIIHLTCVMIIKLRFISVNVIQIQIREQSSYHVFFSNKQILSWKLLWRCTLLYMWYHEIIKMLVSIRAVM